MGLIEAMDFTRENRRGDRGVPIETYMAHHQAMTLLAIDNTVNANVMQTRFHSRSSGESRGVTAVRAHAGDG